MTYDQLFKTIKAGDIRPAYLFYGPETYVLATALDALRGKLLPEGLEALNQNLFEGAADVQTLIDAAETLPLMCDRRLIVLRDWTALTGKGESGEIERFIKWLDDMPSACCLVFVLSDAPDNRKKLAQALKARAEWVEFPLLGDADLYKWCARHVRPHAIDPAAVEQLVFMAGRALTGLIQELDKLCAYAGARETITRADVEAIVTPSTECTVFQMIDCLMRGEDGRAQLLLKNMLENGETRIGTLAMLTRQLRMLTHIRLLRAQGMSLSEIERKLSLNHYAATRAAGQAARFSAEALERGYQACVDTDYAIKSGRVRDSAGLDALMLRLGGMK
ncbi:MAG: DNA polymerase III subunit delta [Clostridia bacterium]|nr:DNA polymerase III subunit delta [Clostridia bacterium]